MKMLNNSTHMQITRILIYPLLLLTFLLPNYAYAWTPNGEKVTIESIYEWQDDNVIMFKTSLGHICYMLPSETNMYSLVLSLWASGKSALIHCRDSEEAYGGISAHRLHRVIAVK